MGSFTPVVFGTNDGVGNGCQRFLKYLADKIAQKDTELYNTVIAWHRTRFAFEQSRSVHACVRGSRTPLQTKNKTLILQHKRRHYERLDFLGNFQAKCLFFSIFFNKFWIALDVKLYKILNFLMKFRTLILSIVFCQLSLIVNKVLFIIFRPRDGCNPLTPFGAAIQGNGDSIIPAKQFCAFLAVL